MNQRVMYLSRYSGIMPTTMCQILDYLLWSREIPFKIILPWYVNRFFQMFVAYCRSSLLLNISNNAINSMTLRMNQLVPSIPRKGERQSVQTQIRRRTKLAGGDGILWCISLRYTIYFLYVSLTVRREYLYEPPHDKTNKMAWAPSEDSDQPGHPPSLIRVFTVRSMGS